MPGRKTLKELLAEKQEISKEQMAAKDKIDRAANEKMKAVDIEIAKRIDEEVHDYWEQSLKPKLHELKELVREGFELFSDYAEEFETHVRHKKSEVADDKLLAEIYGAGRKTKGTRDSTRTLSDQVKIEHVKAYDKAKKTRDGAKYLKANSLNANHIATWRKAFLAALKVTDKP